MYTYGKVWPDASILECLKLTRVGTDSVKLLRFIDIIDFRYMNNNTKGYSEVVSGKDLNPPRLSTRSRKIGDGEFRFQIYEITPIF